MKYVPERGDIIHLQFDPATGQEMQGEHYALVVSRKLFNQRGLAFVCPISQGSAHITRSYGTVVTLMGRGTHTQGTIHCHQLKSLDWRNRQAKRKEVVPEFIVLDVMARIEAILA